MRARDSLLQWLGSALVGAAVLGGVWALPAGSATAIAQAETNPWFGTITFTANSEQTFPGGVIRVVGRATLTIPASGATAIDWSFTHTEESSGCREITRFVQTGSTQTSGEPIGQPAVNVHAEGSYTILAPKVVRKAATENTCSGERGEWEFPWAWDGIVLPAGSVAANASSLTGTRSGVSFSIGGDVWRATWNLTKALPPPRTFADTFAAPSETKPHAVPVPARVRSADLLLRWRRPADRFDVLGATLAPARTTQARKALPVKLKITKLKITATSVTVRVTGLRAGSMRFKIVARTVAAPTRVTTRVTLRR